MTIIPYNKLFTLILIILNACTTKIPEKYIVNLDFENSSNWYPFDVIDKYDFFYIDDKMGLQDKSGNEIIKAKFSNIRFLSKEYLLVEKDKLCGLVDINGKFIIPLEKRCYSITIFPTNNPFVIICSNLDNQEEYYNLNGKEIYPPTNSYELRIFDYFSHKDQHFITLGNGFPYKLLKVERDTIKEIRFGDESWEFVKLKNNLVSFYTEQNQIIKRGFYDINTEKSIILNLFKEYQLKESTNEVWIKTEKYFDIILDSTLNVKANPNKNISKMGE